MRTEHDGEPRLRALIVDDDPVLRMMATAALRELGFETLEAADGHEALERIDAFRPDLVALDVEMPGLDGFATCRAIRERVGDRLAVLMITGHRDAETIDRAFDAGASDFIHKPIDWRLLQHRARFLMRAHSAFAGLRASERRLANAQRIAHVGHWEWEPDADLMLWSEEVWRILGRSPSTEPPRFADLLVAVAEEDRPAVEKAMQLDEEAGASWSLDHRVVTPQGEIRVVRHQAEVVRGRAGEIERVAGTIQDITDRRRAEEQIRFLAHYDSLTSLPNRRMLLEHLQRCLAGAEGHSQGVAVLHVDIDRFKRVNESLGRAVGDEVLRAVAARLLGCLRANDYVAQTPLHSSGSVLGGTVSRVAGDEFTVVLARLRSQDHAIIVARRILETMRAPIRVGDQELAIGVSIGIAVAPADGTETEELLRGAASATRCAKADGGAVYRCFSAEMNEAVERAMRIETALRGAIERGEFALHYQPQWNARTGEIVGAEALARWPGCPLGEISPGEFIPIAENAGLIDAITGWTLRTACQQLGSWNDASRSRLRVSVNLSSRQAGQAAIAAEISGLLAEFDVDPSRLELEITETSILAETEQVVEWFKGLKSLGLGLALDDFGLGYSSLHHVASLPIDVLKIDRSFVSGIEHDEHARAVVAAVIAMARRLSLRTVAEGVETEIQERFLLAEGCEILQGYKLAPALAPEAFAELLRSRGRVA